MVGTFDHTQSAARRVSITKGFSAQGKEISFDSGTVQASDEIMNVPIGITSFEVKAKLLQFQIPPIDLLNALRPYIHETIKGLPSNSLIYVKPVVDAEGEFQNLEVSVVIPER